MTTVTRAEIRSKILKVLDSATAYVAQGAHGASSGGWHSSKSKSEVTTQLVSSEMRHEKKYNYKVLAVRRREYRLYRVPRYTPQACTGLYRGGGGARPHALYRVRAGLYRPVPASPVQAAGFRGTRRCGVYRPVPAEACTGTALHAAR